MVGSELHLQLVVAFVVAGSVVCMCSLFSERLSPGIGAIIGAFPAVACVTFFFLAYDLGVPTAVAATTIAPLVVLANAVLTVVYGATCHRGALPAFLASFLVWICLVSVIHALPQIPFALAVGFVGAGYLIGSKVWAPATRVAAPNVSSPVVQTSYAQLICRFVIGGVVTVTALVASHLVGPALGGTFAVFPAVFATSLVLAHIRRGPQFARLLSQGLFRSGLVNITCYIVSIRFLYGAVGIWAGTAIALCISACVGRWLAVSQKRKREPAAPDGELAAGVC